MSNTDNLNANLLGQISLNIAQLKISKASSEQASQLRQQLRESQSSSGGSSSNSNNQQKNEQLKRNQQNLTFKNKKLTQEVESYKNLLNQKIAENENLKNPHNIQQELLTQEVEFYKDLLSKPMLEIASKNENFKETYRIQQELLANWMLSQKAFKELAIDFGIQLGKTKEEIMDNASQNNIKVLTNKTKHDNNAEDSTIISQNIESLRKRI